MASNFTITVKALLISLLESPLTWPFWIGSMLWPIILIYSIIYEPINLTEISALGFSSETISLLFIIFGAGTAIDLARGELTFGAELSISQSIYGAVLTVFNLNYVAIGLTRLNMASTELIAVITQSFSITTHLIYLLPSLGLIGLLMPAFKYKPAGYDYA